MLSRGIKRKFVNITEWDIPNYTRSDLVAVRCSYSIFIILITFFSRARADIIFYYCCSSVFVSKVTINFRFVIKVPKAINENSNMMSDFYAILLMHQHFLSLFYFIFLKKSTFEYLLYRQTDDSICFERFNLTCIFYIQRDMTYNRMQSQKFLCLFEKHSAL